MKLLRYGERYGSRIPCILDADGQARNVLALNMCLDVNSMRKRTGTTSKIIFNVATTLSCMNGFWQLTLGNLICIGTPAGVGAGMKPPQFLNNVDVVELGITGIGHQRQTVTPHSEAK